MFLGFPEQPRFQHHLGQLFDEQGDAIGLDYHLLVHVGRQRFARVTRAIIASA